MNINIKATGIELTPAISSYVEKKVGTLSKYLDKEKVYIAKVEVGKESKHHKEGPFFKAEIHLIGPALDAYAVAEKEDLYAAIDTVEDEIARTLLSTKGKRVRLARKGERAIKQLMKGFPWAMRKGDEVDDVT